MEHRVAQILNTNKQETQKSYASKLITLDENDFDVETDMACFVFEVCRYSGQEFCFYISPVSYLPFLRFPAKECSHASTYVVFWR